MIKNKINKFNQIEINNFYQIEISLVIIYNQKLLLLIQFWKKKAVKTARNMKDMKIVCYIKQPPKPHPFGRR